jgi:CRISPR-associated Csx2 family protein
MARVFITSLGTGDYKPYSYVFDGRPCEATAYVQKALLRAHDSGFFDRVVLLLTDSARAKHWTPDDRLSNSHVSTSPRVPTLRAELYLPVDPPPPFVLQPISEKISEKAEQWNWFQALMTHVDRGDEIYIDMTHGFRVVPIVLSAALHYLQAIKGVRLVRAWYAADQGEGYPIVDFADFYTLGQWADGVSRLVENADAGKLAALSASGEDNRHFPALNRGELVEPLKELAGILKNVDVHSVSTVARRALAALRAELERLAPEAASERQMIELVVEKFAGLSGEAPPSGQYDRAYFSVQLEMARMLLGHGFLMQAFTVMREMLASIGLAGAAARGKKLNALDTSNGRSQRRVGDVFVSMMNYDEATWRFPDDAMGTVELLRPFHAELMATEAGAALRRAVRRLVEIRNGFDHAWTSVAAGQRPSPENLEKFASEGSDLCNLLEGVVDIVLPRR